MIDKYCIVQEKFDVFNASFWIGYFFLTLFFLIVLGETKLVIADV